MDRLSCSFLRLAPLIVLSALFVTAAGCAAVSHMMYVIKGNEIEAAYDGLEESRVAIVCVSDATSYGPDSLTHVISRAMGTRLTQQVKDIVVIPQHKIETWKDANGWDELDYEALGRGVDAGKVVAVEIGSYSIHEGTTLYKGRAMVTTSVYDLEREGHVVFSQGPAEYQFPKSHGRPAVSTNPQQFEAAYLSMLVDSICRNFHAYEKTETVAEDATEFAW